MTEKTSPGLVYKPHRMRACANCGPDVRHEVSANLPDPAGEWEYTWTCVACGAAHTVIGWAR